MYKRDTSSINRGDFRLQFFFFKFMFCFDVFCVLVLCRKSDLTISLVVFVCILSQMFMFNMIWLDCAVHTNSMFTALQLDIQLLEIRYMESMVRLHQMVGLRKELLPHEQAQRPRNQLHQPLVTNQCVYMPIQLALSTQCQEKNYHFRVMPHFKKSRTNKICIAQALHTTLCMVNYDNPL